MERCLLPRMGVGFWKFLHKYKMTAFGEGVSTASGAHPRGLRKRCSVLTQPLDAHSGLPELSIFGPLLKL